MLLLTYYARNYAGIIGASLVSGIASLLNHLDPTKLMKLMEHVVYSNIMSHLEHHNIILTHQQFGSCQ